MNVFLSTLIILLAMSAVGKLLHLVKEVGPRTTPRGFDAFDVVVNAALIVWAATLLH